MSKQSSLTKLSRELCYECQGATSDINSGDKRVMYAEGNCYHVLCYKKLHPHSYKGGPTKLAMRN